MALGTAFVKLIKTTVFRLSLGFAVLFTLISFTALLYVYFVTIQKIEEQADYELFHELTEMRLYYEENGYDNLVSSVALRDHFGHYLFHYYSLVDEKGQFVVGSQFLLSKEQVVDHETFSVAYSNVSEYISDDGKNVIIRIAQLRLNNGMRLYAALAQNSLKDLREHTLQALIYAVIVTVVLTLLTGLYFGRSVLLRIRRIDKGLKASINSNFTSNLPVPPEEDEFQALTINLNFTLSRVAELIQGMREVTDNIAHDLRSPLNRMRSRLEVAIMKERNKEEYQETIEQTIEDCTGLLNTFNTLLSIAQAESGVAREALESIDLAEITDELAELYHIVAEEKGLLLKWEKPTAIFVNCRRQALAQAISNILENAIKYTPAGGAIVITLQPTDAGPKLMISDTGPGIPEKDRKRVLERFQRLDNARTQPGNGLGLSVVKAIAKLCNAELVLDDNKPGLIVELRFPLCQ